MMGLKKAILEQDLALDFIVTLAPLNIISEKTSILLLLMAFY